MKVRLLPFTVAAGPWQMAADEVLLESAVAGTATIRVYGWEPATVSLGYFQKAAERLHDPQLAIMPWIRRATGGGAIVHDGDLTYSVAVPATQRQRRTPSQWHDHFHLLLNELLQRQALATDVVRGARLPQEALGYRCFAVPQPGDVVLAGRKVVGGAQRLRAGAIMQHGSIQLPQARELAETLPRLMAKALGWDPYAAEWTAPELARIESLAREKYDTTAWNEKR